MMQSVTSTSSKDLRLLAAPISPPKYSSTHSYHSTKAPILIKRCTHPLVCMAHCLPSSALFKNMILQGLVAKKPQACLKEQVHLSVERDGGHFEIVPRNVRTIVIYKEQGHSSVERDGRCPEIVARNVRTIVISRSSAGLTKGNGFKLGSSGCEIAWWTWAVNLNGAGHSLV